MSTVNLPKHVVTNVGSSKLLPKHISPFRVLHRKGNAYTIELPRRMHTHPTFYIGRLRPYRQHEVSSSGEYNRHAQEPHIYSFRPESVSQYGSVVPHADDECQPLLRERLNASSRSPIGRMRTLIGRPSDALHPRLQRETLLSLLSVRSHRSCKSCYRRPASTSNYNKRFEVDIPQPLVDSHDGQCFHVEKPTMT